MKLFKTIKEIRSKSGELHFKRFAFISTSWFTLCLHFIYKADTDPYLHNHPWNLLSLVLWGKYIEKTETELNIRTFGHIAMRNKLEFHKILEVVKPTITLNILWGERTEWGYKIGDKIVSNIEWRTNKEKYTNSFSKWRWGKK